MDKELYKNSDNFKKKESDPFLGKIIAIANQKGGVGKTTSAINIASYLGNLGYNTLLIDMDSQSNATSGLGFSSSDVNKSVYSMIIYNEDPNSVVLSTKYKNLKLIPSTKQLSGAEVELVTVFKREYRLKEAIQKLDENFDFIIVDCPPSVGLLTVNAMAACKDVIVPIQCGYFALEGVAQLLNIVDLVKRSLNPKLDIEGIILTMFFKSKLTEEISKEVREHFKEKVYETVIPKNVRLDEASSHGKPVLYFETYCKGAKAYEELTKEIIMRYKENNQ